MLLQAAAGQAATVVTNVAAGSSHGLFLKSDGSLWSMGWNAYGQLGDGTFISSLRPEQIVRSNVVAIAAGGSHSLFVKSDGSLWAMGDNSAGQLGDGTLNNTNKPEQIADGVVAVAAGGACTLFVKSDGSLWGMGLNGNGQLGLGTVNRTNTPTQIVSNGVVAIACGAIHSLFLKSDGSLWGMGYNTYGQLGDGTSGNYAVTVPELIVSSNVIAIAAGGYHSLFLEADHSLWAMGYNNRGQLGDGTLNYTGVTLPEQIVSNGVVAIAGGEMFSLFLKSDGSLWATGDDYWGQLGDGATQSYTNTPEQIVAAGVIAVSSGGSAEYSLFLKSDGSLWAMGYNHSGQLGDGFASNWPLPEQIVPSPQPVLSDPVLLQGDAAIAVTNIAAGTGYSMFVKSDGSLWAMGDNYDGQLGDGTSTRALYAEQIVGSDVTSVAVGPFYFTGGYRPRFCTLFLKSNGSLWAMGYNGGRFGDGTSTSTNRPEQVVASGVTAVEEGVGHTLFLKSDGSLWGTGDNSRGQLGQGALSLTNRPVQIVSNNVTAIAAGAFHSLFLKSGGSLWAMGYNSSGQLGDGTTNSAKIPGQIISSNVLAIAAGSAHSLFLRSDHSLWATGNNYYGQLGDGTTNTRSSPVEVVSNDVVAVSAGANHNLFLKSNGSLWAMGWNASGQLGDGTTDNALLPRQIVPGGVVAISAGYSHSLFLKSDGTLWGMGDDGSAQLGIGTGNAPFPRQLTGRTGSLLVQATCLTGGPYRLLSCTNLTQPVDQWRRIQTNSVTLRGTNNFAAVVTNAQSPGDAQQFFILQSQ